MQRISVIVLSLLVAACSAGAEPTSTTTSTTTTSTTTTTTSTTTTTTPTTTTVPRLEVEGDDPALAELVTLLYSGEADADSFPGPETVTEAFSSFEGEVPTQATARVADWDENTRLGVVEADGDVTLAVANPDWRIVGGWWPTIEMEVLGSFPKIVAVVGSDARPDENREATRADSIHFVGIDADGNAGIVGVPRDAWVPIPGAGNSKINASLAFGGPEMMMDTFTELTGLDFDGYLLTGFAGFQGLIEVLGGLEMDVPRSFNDKAAKAYLEAGEQVLTAAEALALSRVRKTIPGGDFQRQEHGGLVMMAAQAMLRANGPGGLPGILAGSRPHVSTDLSPADLLRLSAAITRVDPDRVTNVVAQGGVGYAGSASVVFLADSAADLWQDLADGSLESEDG